MEGSSCVRRMNKLVKIGENIYELPKEGMMLVPGVIFASEVLVEKIKQDKTLEQVKNVAQLPGIIEKSIALPDAHMGYGMCIGGVAAFNIQKGIISPGGVGYDINCGVRIIKTNLTRKDFLPKRKEIIEELYIHIPSGVGIGGEFNFKDQELAEILEKGIGWAVGLEYATKEDQECTEDQGCIGGASASNVSQKAKARGRNQLGTLGSGNHFLEIQEVESVFDKKAAEVFGLEKGQIVIMIHSGSRGLGHQTASDYINAMEKEYGWKHLPDRQLAYAPIESQLGKKYRSAMAAAANFAFVNRQLITYQTRKVFTKHFSKVKLELLYDVAHNIAKFEEHVVDGKKQIVCVHRKGATRSFGAGRKELPTKYRKLGQPILLPGSMGTFSYVLLGNERAAELSFSSTAHGAGRVLSRSYAIEHFSSDKVEKALLKENIIIKARSKKGIVEEAPEVYKDINEVARVSDQLGLGSLVARLKPLAVIKG